MLALALLLAAAPHTVAVVPLGPVEPRYLELVKEAIEARADVTVRIDEPRALPPEAFYKPRKRYRAEKLLDALDGTDAWKVIGVTNAEISTTKGKIYDWGIAGLGNINGQSCVVSLHLYKKHSKTQAVLDRRFADVAVHELGHTLGMEHCETKGCVMSDAKGKAMASSDASSGQYCDLCRQRAPEGVLKPKVEARSP
jgi:archaemetzincin